MTNGEDESIFAQLFEAGPDGEFIVAEDGRVRLANAEAHRILGWQPGTLIGQPLDELLPEFRATHGHPSTADPSIPTTRRTDHYLERFVARRRDGTEIPIEITQSAVIADSETLIHIAIRDVSARHAADQKLGEGADVEMLRLLVDGVRDYAIFFLDPDGYVMTWNAGAERIKGYRADEIIGQSHVRFYVPQDVIAGVPSRLLHRATERGVARDEGVRVRKDGSRFWASVVLTALRDRSGRLRGFAKITRDMTEQKRVEQSMTILADASRLLTESLDSEQILFTITHMAVPSFADGVAVHLRDRNGAPHLALYHAANPELLAAVLALQHKTTHRVATPILRVMRTGRSEFYPQASPEWLATQDADDEWASIFRKFGTPSIILVPIIVRGRPFAVITFTAAPPKVYNEYDVVFAEELARRASSAMHNAELFHTAKTERERAEEAATLRERLVAIVGHDLRTPLTSIMMAAEMLSSSALTTTDQHLVSRITASANRMTRMIGQILDFARIRSGQTFELQLEPADLHQVCETAIDEIRVSKPNQQITLNFEGPTDALIDADRIAQVLSNLIGNGIQHGKRGPITVTVREATPDAVAIEVHNLGPTIPKAAQAALFEPFHRETAPGNHSSSIGLGLFIASEIVRAHGGTIAVRSPDRNGTTFAVILPRGHAHPEWSPAEPAPPQVH